MSTVRESDLYEDESSIVLFPVPLEVIRVKLFEDMGEKQ